MVDQGRGVHCSEAMLCSLAGVPIGEPKVIAGSPYLFGGGTGMPLPDRKPDR